MATRTAAQNGLWSDTATWGGTVPVNGDAVVINTGITVTYDVDQSGFANGLLSLQIDGKLTFKPDTNTCLKMNGNITGTGELWVGTEENPIQRPTAGSEYRCYLLFNSTGTINIPTIRMYGWYPEREYTQLSADASAGQNQIVLKDLGLQQGDIIIIGSGTEMTLTSETQGGVYSISSYDSGTNTLVLNENLGTQRINGDYVAILSRPIKIKRSSGTATLLLSTATIDGIICVGVFYDTCQLYSAASTSEGLAKDYILHHCSNKDRPIISAVNNLQGEYIISKGYYPFSFLRNSEVENVIVMGSKVTTAYEGSNDVIFKDCISMNGAGLGEGVTFIDCVATGCNGIPYSNYSKFIRCKFEVGVSMGTIYSACSLSDYIDCDFGTNGLSCFQSAGGILNNCLVEDVPLIKNPRKPFLLKHIESFDHNQIPGNYKAWMKGGRIETDFDGETVLPGRLIFNCESDEYPVFRDFQVQLPQSRTMRWQALTRKSFSGGSVKIELIDPTADPLIDSSAQPLASYSLPDQANTALPLKLGYKSTKSMQAILRISAQKATGTVEIDTRLIENRVQHGR